MKLTCPKCSAEGEIFVVGQDTVAYRCPKCGYVSDIMLSITTKRMRNTENMRMQAIQLGSEGLTIYDVAKILDVSRETLYRWAQSDEELRNALGVRTRKVNK